MCDFELDLSRSLKVESYDAFGLHKHGIPLVFDTNIWPNSAP